MDGSPACRDPHAVIPTRTVVVIAFTLLCLAVLAIVFLSGVAEGATVSLLVLSFPFVLGLVARFRHARQDGVSTGRAVVLGIGLGLRATLPPSPSDARKARSQRRGDSS